MKASILIREMITKSASPALTNRARGKLLTYFENVRAMPFGDQWVLDSAFPPLPGKAFSMLLEGLGNAEQGRQRPSMVTVAVTNRCMLDCRHCYNAGRDQTDLPLDAFRRVAGELLDLGAARVTLTGGEPLLRDDIEEICRCFDDRCTLALSTTGLGLTPSKARDLKRAGLFALGVSMDSDRRAEHDRLRGREGMFDVALRALATARDAGLFPYVLAMARPELIPRERFMRLLEVAGIAGALEVVILEPVPVGNMAGRCDVGLTQSQRGRLLLYQREVSCREELPLAHLHRRKRRDLPVQYGPTVVRQRDEGVRGHGHRADAPAFPASMDRLRRTGSGSARPRRGSANAAEGLRDALPETSFGFA